MDIQRDDFAERAAIVDLLNGFSLEVTPAGARKVTRFDRLLRPGTRVFITSLPGSDPAALVETAGRLAGEGMRAVPHIAARDLAGREALARLLEALVARAGVDELLLIAGGGPRQAGPFDSTAALLRSGCFDGLALSRLWIAGHPESHPLLDATALEAALVEKRALAAAAGLPVHLVTQFGFDADPLLHWAGAIARDPAAPPVHAGLAGVCSMTSLLRYAGQCGIGASLGTLRRQAGKIGQMLAPVTPDRMVRALAVGAMQTGVPLAPLHFFPFGGLDATVKWAHTVLEGRFELDRRGGLSLH